ncbi:hypothetical protein, partial [Haloferula sp. A504]|uniref:hypothetical protein n=1 Tax=Haloferula sp. A504 TaxID=3373601 RepID=UPI0031BCC58F|nr:hypothetical protein [Verrucomicrobiaceae bacterium E54]
LNIATLIPELAPVESMSAVVARSKELPPAVGAPRLFQCFPSPAGDDTLAAVDQSMSTVSAAISEIAAK